MHTVVIANNFLSNLTNNGKTLKFLLSGYDPGKLIWIYTTPLESDMAVDMATFRIPLYGRLVGPDESLFSNKAVINAPGECAVGRFPKMKVLRYLTKRLPAVLPLFKLLRELLIFSNFNRNVNVISGWISQRKVDKVIFVGGDFIYLHCLAVVLSRALSVPLHVYITDDYLLEYSTGMSSSFRKGIHNRLLRKFFLRTLSSACRIHFVSEKMRDVYLSKFGFNGPISFNAAFKGQNLARPSFNYAEITEKDVVLCYFGSLHSGRAESLNKFARMLEDFNKRSGKVIKLEVYSGAGPDFASRMSSSVLNFNPPMVGEDFEAAVRNSDALLILESSDLESLRLTWLSFSTKVMEYLAAQKPIVAFGPLENPSIGELVSSGAAIHVTSERSLDLLFDLDLLSDMAHRSASFRTHLEALNTFL